MKVAQSLLAAGLICATLGAALCEFVLVGLIGCGLLLVAFFLLLFAGLLAWNDGLAAVWQRGAGLALVIVADLLLLAVASYASMLAFEMARRAQLNSPAATSIEWINLGLLSLMPAVALLVGLRWRAGWSWRRCAFWGIACLCVCPAAIGLFWLLTPYIPLTA
jgi:hypothetical protein